VPQKSRQHAQSSVAGVMHKEKMGTKPILEEFFYHDGRGPELQNVVWKKGGVIPLGFEYFNPDDGYEKENIKHIVLLGVQAFSMATEEVHGNILASGDSNAAILEVVNSEWLKSYLSIHLEKCKHYQIMFYDEIYDIVCESVVAGKGRINA
jgi:hypothetical protein